jgi:lysyl-tRNA synthetase class II
MKKNFLFAILFLLLISKSHDCYAQSISSIELINNAKNYNGNTVVYKGEVIGDIMLRGEYAWVNVNDGKNAIGIWIRKELIKDILYTGSYKSRGDIIEITGKFNRSCLEHGGDLDIHAQDIRKIISGKPIYRVINLKRVYISLLLFIAFLLAYLLRKFIPA